MKMMTRMSKLKFSQLNQKTQRERFEETARELECDESEERFNETLKRVVKSKPKQDQDGESS